MKLTVGELMSKIGDIDNISNTLEEASTLLDREHASAIDTAIEYLEDYRAVLTSIKVEV